MAGSYQVQQGCCWKGWLRRLHHGDCSLDYQKGTVTLAFGDGGVYGAGGPGGGFMDEAVEDGLRGGAQVVAALGVPLDA